MYRAGVIGSTGRGHSGHGLDVACVALPGVETVAVADPDEAGRQDIVARAVPSGETPGAARGYADYRDMLARERLDLVVIAITWPSGREAIVAACVQAGVKAIFTEKPFAQSLDAADRMVALCDAHGVKLAVAHQNRVRPAPLLARRLVREGKVGRLRVVRGYGKQDRRGGGVDLLWLGVHSLDFMRTLGGDARWCHARVVANGRDATAASVHLAEKEGGLVAGDDVVATYGFDAGVTGTFESTRAEDGGGTAYLRMELCGTGGILAYSNDVDSPVWFCPRPFALPDTPGEWERLEPDAVVIPAGMKRQHAANQALVRDLLAAVEDDRPPVSSGHDARAALEMILAVYESHRQGRRVALPLAERDHPLARWSAAR